MLLSEERKNNVSLHLKKKDMEINGNNFSSPTEAGMYLYRQYANISGLVDKSPEEMSPDEVRSLQSYCKASYNPFVMLIMLMLLKGIYLQPLVAQNMTISYLNGTNFLIFTKIG